MSTERAERMKDALKEVSPERRDFEPFDGAIAEKAVRARIESVFKWFHDNDITEEAIAYAAGVSRMTVRRVRDHQKDVKAITLIKIQNAKPIIQENLHKCRHRYSKLPIEIG